VNGSVKSEEHIKDLSTISKHLKQSSFLIIELAVNENQEKYEIPLELLKELANNRNRRLTLQISNQELLDRYGQMHWMLNEQEKTILRIQ
jgi:hypothetical protein